MCTRTPDHSSKSALYKLGTCSHLSHGSLTFLNVFKVSPLLLADSLRGPRLSKAFIMVCSLFFEFSNLLNLYQGTFLHYAEHCQAKHSLILLIYNEKGGGRTTNYLL